MTTTCHDEYLLLLLAPRPSRPKACRFCSRQQRYVAELPSARPGAEVLTARETSAGELVTGEMSSIPETRPKRGRLWKSGFVAQRTKSTEVAVSSVPNVIDLMNSLLEQVSPILFCGCLKPRPSMYGVRVV